MQSTIDLTGSHTQSFNGHSLRMCKIIHTLDNPKTGSGQENTMTENRFHYLTNIGKQRVKGLAEDVKALQELGYEANIINVLQTQGADLEANFTLAAQETAKELGLQYPAPEAA